MKIKFFLILCVWAMSSAAYSIDIKVMSYNIRVDIPTEVENSWANRKDAVCNILGSYQADIIGMQEALLNQVNDIAAQMPGYDWVGVGRDNGVIQGEFSPIFYNSQKYQLKEQGWFWLSETPNIPTIGWDAAYPRICTYILLEDYDTRENFWVFNTHLDHLGIEAREKSVKLIWNKIQELTKPKQHVLLTGDFNSVIGEKPITFINRKLNDAKQKSITIVEGPEGTFNDFDITSKLENRIDYIFVSKKIEVFKYAVLYEMIGQRYPSDHFPVYTEISF